ncbi:tRNA-uridine aminocarboxypropyltransferase [Vibrio rarus]|uniref:tRNA-uridine aminocarboxypropyltransferase n=1 Tax=Vibrio rarus TaxID=413403 RepID=UPI0021C3B323|nr:tRNA-uridine aminocarboxypropyltransferase [Vibrio rarus]
MSRYCERCGRAKKACLCQWIQPVTSTTEVVILQHPSEVNQAKGTAKIVELTITPCQVFVGENFSEHARINQWLNEPDTVNLLLFPSQNSSQLHAQYLTGKGHNKVRLFLIDGTWKKAFKIYQLSQNLQQLTQVHLAPDLQGRYTIRKAPKDNALSTVEAAYFALTQLGACDATPLISAFDHMVEFQISQLPEGTFDKYFAGRKR